MKKIVLSITLDESDWHAYMSEATQRTSAASATGIQRAYRWLPFSFLLLLAVLTIVGYAIGMYGHAALAALIAVSLFIGMLRLISTITAKPLDHGIFLGPAELEIDATGMSLRKATYQSAVTWTRWCDISDTPTHIFVWIDRFTAQVIPLRELPPDLPALALVSALRGFIANAAASSKSAPQHSSASSPVAPFEIPAQRGPPEVSVLAELSQLLKLFLLVDARPALLQGRDLTIGLLAGLSVLSLVLFERLAHGGDAQFMVYGIPGLGWLATIGLLLAWLLARLSRVAFRRVLLLVCALGFLVSLIFGVAGRFGGAGTVVAYALVGVELFAFLGRGMTLLAGRPRRGSFAAGVLLLLGCAYINQTWYLTPSLWFEPEPESASGFDSWADREQLAYGQALSVDAALNALKRADRVEPQMFFLGFAGYGGQHVFAEEIGLAASRVHQRFETAGRSMRLINDRRDPEKYPWATASSLRHALQGMGKIMDLERDVLFLSLSSHGSEDGGLTVNDGMSFSQNLVAGDLATMLRDSGIRWKVIVISACHAGSFIDELRDENTMILTAAAADRTSFGCSDDRDLTYFGEAFYRDAMPTANGLRAAFDSARVALAAREKAEGLRPSNPQAHIGGQIERKLAELEAARPPR
jgi:hypothetical protein